MRQKTWSSTRSPQMLKAAAFVAITCAACALVFEPNSLDGVEYNSDGLTQKQLAVIRHFASLTSLARYANGTRSWEPWGPPNPDCDQNDCIRYQISALAYAVAVAATRTPAFPTLYHDILADAAARMVDKRVWQYIEEFPEFQAQSTYPNPVAYKVSVCCLLLVARPCCLSLACARRT